MSRRVCLVKDPRCGTRAGARAHAKRGEHLCPPCDAANRAYHREYGKIGNRARQRTLTELRIRHPERFAAYASIYRFEVDAEIEADGEKISNKARLNRIRQRALCALGREFRAEYQPIYTDKLMEILMEEADHDDG